MYINAILGTCFRLTATTSIQIVTITGISESGTNGSMTSPMYVAAQHIIPLIAIILERSKIFQCIKAREGKEWV